MIMKNLTVPLKDGLYEQFKEFCEHRGEPMTVHVRRYIIQRLEQEQKDTVDTSVTYPEVSERVYQ
jgi:hypothetical protein